MDRLARAYYTQLIEYITHRIRRRLACICGAYSILRFIGDLATSRGRRPRRNEKGLSISMWICVLRRKRCRGAPEERVAGLFCGGSVDTMGHGRVLRTAAPAVWAATEADQGNPDTARGGETGTLPPPRTDTGRRVGG